MRRKRKLIRKARHKNKREHLLYWLVGLAELLDGIVIVCTLGFIASNIHGWVIFGPISDYLDKDNLPY